MRRERGKPDVVFVDVRPIDRRVARRLGVPEERLGPLSQLNSAPHLRALQVNDAWLPVDLGDQWRVAYRLAVQGGAVVVSEVRVLPREGWSFDPSEWSADYLGSSAPVPLGGITARLLRQVRVGEHYRVADKVLRKIAGDPFPLAQDAAARHGLIALDSAAAQRRGRPRRPDLFYAQVAQRYEAALKQESPRPALEVARAMGTSGGQVRQWIHTARDRRLLTRVAGMEREGQQGQKGGNLTPRADAILAGAAPAAKGKEVRSPERRRTQKKVKPTARRRKR